MTAKDNRKLKVALDCRVDNFKHGVGTAIIALAREFSRNPKENEEIAFITLEGSAEPLKEFQRPDGIRLITSPPPRKSALRAQLAKITPLHGAWGRVYGLIQEVPPSDGILESNGFDVVHFPTQRGCLTSIPSIYQPHDLQHLYFPKNFPWGERSWRERTYRKLCEQATLICTHTNWGKADLVAKYDLDPNKIVIIPWGSIFEPNSFPGPQEMERVARKFSLPERFLFLPAATWIHKNHDLLIRAIARLRREGLDVPAICTGQKTEYYPKLRSLARELRVDDLVVFLGFVDSAEVEALYRLATALVFPTRFEGFGLPIQEAFQAGLPVVCSRVTVLPEVAGDAALFFEDNDSSSAAKAIREIWVRPDLREDLIMRGRKRAAEVSMTKTIEHLRAAYWKAAQITRAQPG